MHLVRKSAGTSQAKAIQNLVAGESGGKVKRKSSSMMKIAETTQLVTRFARSRNSAGGSAMQQVQQQQYMHQQQHQRMMFKGQGGAGSGSVAARMHSAGVMGHMQGNGGGGGRAPNKFKTGGLVITAVQQPANMPGGGSSRRMRNAAGLQAKSSIGALGSSSGQMQYQRSNGNVQANKTSTGISLDTVNLVRKVKTKLKKRKSRTLSNGAPK